MCGSISFSHQSCNRTDFSKQICTSPQAPPSPDSCEATIPICQRRVLARDSAGLTPWSLMRLRDAFSERLAGHDFLSLSGHSFGSGKLHRQRVYTHDSCATSAPQWDHGIGQHAAGRGACLLGAGAEGGGRRSEKGGGKGSGLLSTHPACARSICGMRAISIGRQYTIYNIQAISGVTCHIWPLWS